MFSLKLGLFFKKVAPETPLSLEEAKLYDYYIEADDRTKMKLLVGVLRAICLQQGVPAHETLVK